MVARHENPYVDHILGRTKRRRMAEAPDPADEHGEAGALGHRQHVDALVDPILPPMAWAPWILPSGANSSLRLIGWAPG